MYKKLNVLNILMKKKLLAILILSVNLAITDIML